MALRRFLDRLIPGAAAARSEKPATPESDAEGWIAEGQRLEGAGRSREALDCYRRAVAAAPLDGKAQLNLGIGLEAIGDGDGAVAAYRAALAIDPGDAYANYNLGKLLFTQGALTEAEQLLRRALVTQPEFPEAEVVLAQALEAMGNPAAAAQALERALSARPDYFGALCNYAAVLRRLGRPGDSEAALRRALALDAGDASVNYELATLLMARGALSEAESLVRRALRTEPRFAAAYATLSDICGAQGDVEGSAKALEAVVALRPDWVEARYNYGCMLKKQMKLDGAEDAFRRAIALNPQFVPAHRMLGSVLLGQCQIPQALQVYGEGRLQAPSSFELESAELFALNASDEISTDELFARHLAFGARLEEAIPCRFAPFDNAPDPNRRLRIGYVSGDFCYHVVTLFLTPVIEQRDRSSFEVYCYSTGGRVDEFTRRLSAQVDVWRDAAPLSDRELADLVHKDGIDILVDLGGHSGLPKLGVFAQRPAPVQATWLGYLSTSGLTRIQYRISDVYSDPPGQTDRLHTERLVRLPHSQWCYRPFVTIDHVSEPPCARNGYITFGSFNQAVKLSPSVRRLWAEILTQLPESRLVVLGVQKGRAQEDLYRDLADGGVARDRVSIHSYVSLEDYFRWYNAIDIALDTLPYSGGTTTCDALWMGVPVVTSPGERSSSRSAASILTTAGLRDWIAATREEYVALAVRFAGQREALAALRASLRSRIRSSPLMDEKRFARDIEEAYRSMWRSWCDSGDGR